MTQPQTFVSAADDNLIRYIDEARTRIVFIAPGLSKEVADALGKKIVTSNDGKLSVTVILDGDPEVCRLGLGTIEGLQTISEHATKNCVELRSQPGVRVGVLITDDSTLLFAPVPKLVEDSTRATEKPSAILLRSGSVTESVAEAAGATNKTTPMSGEIGREALTREAIANAAENLTRCPPQPFDLTRQAFVFSSRLQFVEFSVVNYKFNAKTVPIPADLMGFSGELADRWRSGLRVLESDDSTRVRMRFPGPGGKDDEDIEVTPTHFDKWRKQIEDAHLITVPGFGRVIFREDQRSFDELVRVFEVSLQAYAECVSEAVKGTLGALVDRVVKSLLPAVQKNPPERFTRWGGNKDDLKAMLKDEIVAALRPETLIGKPSVRVLYKNIAHQSVRNKDFKDCLHKALRKANVPQSRMRDIFLEATAALKRGDKL